MITDAAPAISLITALHVTFPWSHSLSPLSMTSKEWLAYSLGASFPSYYSSSSFRSSPPHFLSFNQLSVSSHCKHTIALASTCTGAKIGIYICRWVRYSSPTRYISPQQLTSKETSEQWWVSSLRPGAAMLEMGCDWLTEVKTPSTTHDP